MPVQGITVTLTTTAVLLAGSTGTSPQTATRGVIRVIVRNRGTGTAYLGASDVTTNGFPLSTADNHVDIDLYPQDVLWGTSTGAAIAHVLRLNETT